jgi:glycosyltransferase involved in cell wall biosynthesis
MKVLVIAPSLRDTSPGSRFRIEQWIPYMERAGAEFTYASFEDDALHRIVYTQGNYVGKALGMVRALGRRFALLPGVRGYDVVFIYEEASRIGPAIIERLVKALGVPIVYDFCDPVYLAYKSPSNSYLSYLKFFGKTGAICRYAQHVLVGNEELGDYARRFNANVTVVPITIDTEVYRPRAKAPSAGPPIIGWSGSLTTVPHLNGLVDALKELRTQREFRMRVIGTPEWRLEGVEVEAMPWRAATELDDLAAIDIGIMPLPDDEWTRLRSHLKVRQYMGLGIPCVASPVGVNRELISDGHNGFLASTREEWLQKLTRLLDDAELRRTFSVAGRKTIEERYSAAVWAPRVLQFLRDAAR